MMYWLMKSEPNEFSIEDLEKINIQLWDGIRNYQVRNMFRDQMKAGDKALFYHSSCKDVGVVGEMEVINPALPDPAQFDKKSKYFDAKSTKENPRWLGPEMKFVSKFKHLVTLADIRLDPFFDNIPLVKRGNRLSTFPISKEHYERLVKLGK